MCDGPPFAYHSALEAARAHLKALGAPGPTDLPPYDESKHEPMPEVEINPPDKFGERSGLIHKAPKVVSCPMGAEWKKRQALKDEPCACGGLCACLTNLPKR